MYCAYHGHPPYHVCGYLIAALTRKGTLPEINVNFVQKNTRFNGMGCAQPPTVKLGSVPPSMLASFDRFSSQWRNTITETDPTASPAKRICAADSHLSWSLGIVVTYVHLLYRWRGAPDCTLSHNYSAQRWFAGVLADG